MGIKVHKILGYGLTDVVTDKSGTIIDPRFTKDFLENEKLNLKDFISFAKARPDHEDQMAGSFTKAVVKEPDSWRPHRSFIHQSEYGLPNVFIVTPAEETKNWQRYDDMIDYIEEKSSEPHVKVLNRTLYPYDSWMNPKTGERTKDAHSYWQVVNFFKETNDLEQIDTYLKAQGFTDLKNFEETVVPFVPHTIRLLCEWAKIFKDPKTALELRPMIYVYWS